MKKKRIKMYKYKAIVVNKVVVRGHVWYDVETEVNVEANSQKDTTNPDSKVDIRVSKYVTISVTATDLKEIEGTGFTE